MINTGVPAGLSYNKAITPCVINSPAVLRTNQLPSVMGMLDAANMCSTPMLHIFKVTACGCSNNSHYYACCGHPIQ